MLTAVLGLAVNAAAYAPGSSVHIIAPAVGLRAAARSPAVIAADDGSLLQSMSDSFYANKRARLEAELASRLSELEEYEARERALLEVSQPAVAGASPDIVAELEAEKAKTAALEAELAQVKVESEVALQKVAAYWVAKLAEAKEAPTLAAAPAAAAAAAPAAASAAPAADLVPGELEFIDPDLSLRELRVRLLSYGLSTAGLKSELRTRLQDAMLMGRQQFKSWDTETLTWN
eukprot:CAMPEP_0115847028 /NCGR_PEP_ID=MMETSP0287-20121206/10168_1 /TAXON_ID=412157 /ORGANISM="Chrysochromulina rotalis, Strain UIO044" /LENGTH=232 /DNA_ID=CAMNT_0003300843 /DNA_START=58 /DNA_END=756 /DNA_ORIENTATION=+